MHRHEHARAVPVREFGDAGVQFGRYPELDPATAERLLHGTGAVGGQLDDVGQARELLGPEPQLPRDQRVGIGVGPQHLVLPEGVVGVLHRQRRPLGTRPRGPSGVRGHQVPAERRHRVAVGADVVHDDDQDVVLVVDLEEFGAHRRCGGDVEPVRGEGGDLPAQLGVVVDRDGRQVGEHVADRPDLLRRLLVDDRVGGAQRLVPFEDVADRVAQCVGVECPGEVHRHRDVVGGGPGVELVDEPHALLRERQRDTVRPFATAELRPGVPGAGAAFARDPLCERVDRRRLEQCPHRDVGVEQAAEPGGDAGGDERVTAEIEEAVVDADPVDAEHLGEHVGQRVFEGVGRGAELAAGERELGFGQRGAIELADRGQRDLVEHGHRGGHHVGRQLFRQPVEQGARLDGGPGRGDHVRREHGVAGRSGHAEGDREPDRGIGGQRGVDLAEFDAEPADLHLEVRAADVFDRQVGAPAHDVAGAVHPFARLTERVRHEAFRGQSRTPVVAASQSEAGDVQLAGHPDRHRLQAPVENHLVDTADGATDGDLFADGHGRADVRHDRRLGRPVRVVQVPARGPARDQFRRAGLAADRDVGELVEPGRIDGREGGGGHERVGDVTVGEDAGQVGSAEHRGFGDHHRRAHTERLQVLEHRAVEAGGGEVQGPGCGGGPEAGLLVEGEVVEAAVRDDDALGPARRPGGVDDVRGVFEPERRGAVRVGDRGVGVGRAGRRDVRVLEGEPGDGVGQPVSMRRDGQTEAGTGIGEHVFDPFGRIVGVDRDEGGTGLGDRPHREHRLHGPGYPQRDVRLRSHTLVDEDAGDPRRPGVEFAVGDLATGERQRDRVGVQGRGVGEDVGQGADRSADRALDRRQIVALGVGEQVQAGERTVRVGRDVFEDDGDACRDRLDHGGVEDLGEVLELEVQAAVHRRHQRQRVVRGVAAVDTGDLEAGDVGVRGQSVAVHRVRLEHREGVEGGGRAGGALDVGEPEVVVVEERGLLALDAIEQFTEGFAGVEGDPHRQRVDEQTDHRLDAGNLRGPTGHGAAEQDIRARRQRAEHDAPRGLHDGVEGQPALPDEGPQRVGVLRGQGHLQFGGPAAGTGDGGGQQGRLLEPGERLAPRVGGLGRVLRRHPRQVVAVRVHSRQYGRIGVGRVQSQQIADHQGCGPAVEQDVVVGDDQAVVAGTELHQRHPDRGRRRQIESGPAIGGNQFVEAAGAGARIEAREVHLGPRQFHAVGDHLHRAAVRRGTLDPDERRPQIRVPVEQRLSRPPQPVGVDRAAQRQRQLHQIRVHGVVGEHRVEVQARLQRRQRPHVVQARVPVLECLDRVLVEPDQVQIGRGEPARSGMRGVPCERGQRPHPQVGEFPDVDGREDPAGERPRGAQPRPVGGVADDGIDVEGGRDRHRGARGVVEFGVGHRNPRHVGAGRGSPEPAEVVEPDLRHRQFRQHRPRARIEVPEHPEPDAVIGDRQQLFLDGLEGCPGGRPRGERVVDVDSGQIQADREDRREPSDGSSQVGPGHHLILAAVALEVDQCGVGVGPAGAPPPGQCHRQRGEQGVVDVAAEHLRHRREQCLGDRGRQFHGHLVDRPVHVDRRVERTRPDHRVRGVEGALPQLELAVPACGRIGQTVRPAPHGGAGRCQVGQLPRGDPRPRGGQVRNQDAPGDSVHGEVVNHQEQPTPGLAGVEPHRLQHGSGSGIQAAGGVVERRTRHGGEVGSGQCVDGDPGDQVVGVDRPDRPDQHVRVRAGV